MYYYEFSQVNNNFFLSNLQVPAYSENKRRMILMLITLKMRGYRVHQWIKTFVKDFSISTFETDKCPSTL